jgi:hypothetical protein
VVFSCVQCHVSKRPTCDQATLFLLRLAVARPRRTSRDGGEASLSIQRIPPNVDTRINAGKSRTVSLAAPIVWLTRLISLSLNGVFRPTLQGIYIDTD